ncbi:MAG: hypothetical protein Kow0025_00470 [Thermodesulfovibrionales bacterium]
MTVSSAKGFIVGFLASAALLALAGAALAGQCGDGWDKITDDNRRFALENPVLQVRIADIGCAILYRGDQCGTDQVRFDESSVVHDYLTGEPVPFREAHFVAGSGVETPGGYGIVAFREEESARRFVSERGEGAVLSHSDLLKVELAR